MTRFNSLKTTWLRTWYIKRSISIYFALKVTVSFFIVFTFVNKVIFADNCLDIVCDCVQFLSISNFKIIFLTFYGSLNLSEKGT